MKGNAVVLVKGCRVGLRNVDKGNEENKMLLSFSLLLKVLGLTCHNPDTSLSQGKGEEENISVFF